MQSIDQVAGAATAETLKTRQEAELEASEIQTLRLR